jgi:hypothetical protein
LKPEDFIRRWQSAQTLKDFCAGQDITPANARSRANYYRSKGIPLKRLTNGGGVLDIVALKNLAEKVNPLDAREENVV